MSVCHICWKYFWQPFLKSTFYSFLLMCCFVMASLFLNLKLYPHVRKFSPQHIPFSTSYLCFHLKTEIFFLLKYSLLGSKSVIIDLKKWRGEEKYIGSFILFAKTSKTESGWNSNKKSNGISCDFRKAISSFSNKTLHIL